MPNPWPDDSNAEPPTERTSNVIAWVAFAFVAVVVACLILKGAQ